MEEPAARETQPETVPAIQMAAKWTVSGHTGYRGDLAQQHVAEELGPRQGQSGRKQNMVEEIVQETHPETNLVIQIVAHHHQWIASGDSGHHGDPAL